MNVLQITGNHTLHGKNKISMYYYVLQYIIYCALLYYVL